MRKIIALALALAALLAPAPALAADTLGCAHVEVFSANPSPADQAVHRFVGVNVAACGKVTAKREVVFAFKSGSSYHMAPPVVSGSCALWIDENPAPIWTQGWELLLLRNGIVEDAVDILDLPAGTSADVGLSWGLVKGLWTAFLPLLPTCVVPG